MELFDMSDISFPLALTLLTTQIAKKNKLTSKSISEISKVVETITNSSTTITSASIANQMQQTVMHAKSVLWQSQSKNKVEKTEKLYEISNAIMDSTRRGKTPDLTRVNIDTQVELIKEHTSIISAGLDNGYLLDKQIMVALSQCLTVSDNALKLLEGNPGKSIGIIQKHTGTEITSPTKQAQVISTVKKMLNGQRKLIAQFIADNGRNITTYKNNRKITNTAQIFTSDFYNRLFVGDSFSKMHCYERLQVIFHEVSHLLGTEDHFYLLLNCDGIGEGLEFINQKSDRSQRIVENFYNADLNASRFGKLISASGEKNIDDAINKLNSDPEFKRSITLNNADTIAMIALELHCTSIGML